MCVLESERVLLCRKNLVRELGSPDQEIAVVAFQSLEKFFECWHIVVTVFGGPATVLVVLVHPVVHEKRLRSYTNS